jgi:hypothetical protein
MGHLHHNIALAFLETFKDLNYEANISLRATDCRHSFAPGSLGIKDKNNEQFASHVKSLQQIIKGIPVSVKQIFGGSNEITIWATSETLFREEVKERNPSLRWKYEGEYIFVLTLDDAGEKIQHILEFLDSKKVEEVRTLMQVAKATLE